MLRPELFLDVFLLKISSIDHFLFFREIFEKIAVFYSNFLFFMLIYCRHEHILSILALAAHIPRLMPYFGILPYPCLLKEYSFLSIEASSVGAVCLLWIFFDICLLFFFCTFFLKVVQSNQCYHHFSSIIYPVLSQYFIS